MTELGRYPNGRPDPTAVTPLGSLSPNAAPGSADPTTLALEAYIEASMKQLLHGQAGTPSHGLIFLSSWHESMPALVHLDPVLDPVDSRVFAVLWIWAKQQGRGAMAFPSYDYLLRRCNVQSRSTLARSLAILRVTRWVTLCRRVRDGSGRNRGNIYALHEEPLALASTLYLDPDYMEFLEIKTRDRHERVCRVANAMRASLQECIDEGEDVLSASVLSQAEQRLEALATIVGQGSGHYFWLRQGAFAALQAAKKNPLNQAREGTTHPVQNMDSDRVHFLDSGTQSKICTDSVQNMDSYLCSSSYINTKKPTTTTPDQHSYDVSRRPDVSSSTLVYPDALSRNEQHLAWMYLQGLDAELQQALLDELADKIKRQAKTERPVRNPVGLLAWMCQKARAGHPPLTSAHLQYRERRARDRHLREHDEAQKRRLTEMALRQGAALRTARRGGTQ